MKLGLASSCPGRLDSSSTSSGSPRTDLPIWNSLCGSGRGSVLVTQQPCRLGVGCADGNGMGAKRARGPASAGGAPGNVGAARGKAPHVGKQLRVVHVAGLHLRGEHDRLAMRVAHRQRAGSKWLCKAARRRGRQGGGVQYRGPGKRTFCSGVSGTDCCNCLPAAKQTQASSSAHRRAVGAECPIAAALGWVRADDRAAGVYGSQLGAKESSSLTAKSRLLLPRGPTARCRPCRTPSQLS